MENSLDENWKNLVIKLSHRFGEGLDLQAILFLIGLQELGQGYQKLTKNQKLDVIHVAVCALLSQWGVMNSQEMMKKVGLIGKLQISCQV